jgi:chemotaxis response regulator CheB
MHQTFLLVDDNAASRADLQEILRQAGCSVVGTATNTDDAMRKFEALRPQAVVIDLTLPGTDDPLVVIRKLRRLDSTVVVFATGTASQSARMMEALTMGAADFLFKPYQPRSVRTSIQQNLG